jgi:DNA-binding NarL/FixJ family response regulator
MRIVIADDDSAVRELARVHLELAGHEIVGEADDGSEALRLVEQLHPDILVLDMMMPSVTGRGVLRTLAAGATSIIPAVVAYSAAHNEVAAAIELGADAAVLKNGDLTELVQAVDAF